MAKVIDDVEFAVDDLGRRRFTFADPSGTIRGVYQPTE
jgi:hypothetical protein